MKAGSQLEYSISLYKYFIDELEESISLAMSHCDKVLCLGDFFYVYSPDYKYLSSMLYSTSMHEFVSDVTHVTDHSISLH